MEQRPKRRRDDRGSDRCDDDGGSSGMPKHGPTLDESAENANGECRIAAAPDQRPQRGDVERGIERSPDRLQSVEAGALELVEAPLDDGVRRRTLEPRREREERWLPQ